MEQGKRDTDGQKDVANEKDGPVGIAEMVGLFVKLRNRGLKMSGTDLLSVFGFISYARKADSRAREKAIPDSKQHPDKGRSSGQTRISGLSIWSSEIVKGKPELQIKQLPIFFGQNRFRNPIASEGRLLRVLKSEAPSIRLTSPNPHDAKEPDEYRRQRAGETKEGASIIGKIARDHRLKREWPINHQLLNVAPLFPAQRTKVGKEKTRGIGLEGKKIEFTSAYDLRTPGNLEKFRLSGVKRVSYIGIAPSPGKLQSGTMPFVESRTISRNYLNKSVWPVSLKAEMPMGSKLLSDDRQFDQTNFDLPAGSGAGKGRRGVDSSEHQRKQGVKVEINQPLIGSVTIQSSRGDAGLYDLRAKIEGVLLDILESVNTIG